MGADQRAESFTLRLTAKEAAFVHRLGRHVRKQEGWWDDDEWGDVSMDLAATFESLPWKYEQ